MEAPYKPARKGVKFAPKYQGPYRIKSFVTPHVAVLDAPNFTIITHTTKLIRHHERVPILGQPSARVAAVSSGDTPQSSQFTSQVKPPAKPSLIIIRKDAPPSRHRAFEEKKSRCLFTQVAEGGNELEYDTENEPAIQDSSPSSSVSFTSDSAACMKTTAKAPSKKKSANSKTRSAVKKTTTKTCRETVVQAPARRARAVRATRKRMATKKAAKRPTKRTRAKKAAAQSNSSKRTQATAVKQPIGAHPTAQNVPEHSRKENESTLSLF